MHRVVMAIGLGVFLSALGGCEAGGGGERTITDRGLSGKIGGVAWAWANGQTDAFLSTDDTFFVELYGSAFTACSGAAPVDGNSFSFDIPKAEGSYTLGLNHNATFRDAAAAYNRVATRGLINIESITATTIMGGANVTFDANNDVDGKFMATICP